MGFEKPSSLPVFTICCWTLALLAFSQLLVTGLALATRFEASREVRTVIREVPKVVVMRVPSPGTEPNHPSPVVVRPPLEALTSTAAASLPAPLPLSTPQVGDPHAERLVKEARQARVAGDMGLAIVKLNEALSLFGDDPSVNYELGLVHEQMGVFVTASDYYEKVLRMGVSGAGSLYELAAAKLRDGIKPPDVMRGRLALGRIRIFNNPNGDHGQQVILTIPLQKAPEAEIEIAKITVSVTFFNQTAKDEIVQLEDNSWVTEKWNLLPFKWVGDEESLQMTYVIPSQDSQTEHLFGERSYYGQVVTLLYENEVLDVQAWPRHLASRMSKTLGNNSGEPLLPDFQDSPPPGFDPNLPLLPPLPRK